MPDFLKGALLDFSVVFGTLLLLKYFPGPLRKGKLAVRRLAHWKGLSLVLAGAIPVLLHLAFFPRPEPTVQDEFAYLLQADTFAHGRLTNPAPPLWQHFEQFHVLVHPVFASKYPPLPALFLAAGQVFGDPYYGLLLTAAVAFPAALWMLYGWLPPTYALLGWFFALTQFGPTSYWMNTYWGGLVPALGGFLVIGAWPRLRRRITIPDSMLLGLGCVVLAASRPYEGMILCAIACGSLLWLNGRKYHWLYATVPVALAGLSLLGFYNFKVTGSPWQLPYQVHDAQYVAYGNFAFSHRTPELGLEHPELQALYVGYYGDAYRAFHQHLWRVQNEHFSLLWSFFCGSWGLSLPLVALPFALTTLRIRQAAIMLGLFAPCLTLLIFVFPHYAAPGAGLMLIVLVGGLHRLRFWNPQGKPTGSLAARVAIAAVLVLFVRDLVSHTVRYTGYPPFKAARRALIAQLNAEPAKQLVLVHYGPHDPGTDYVVNGADLEGSHILWARSMDPQADRELLRFFSNRRAWLLNVNGDQAKLEPIPPQLVAGP